MRLIGKVLAVNQGVNITVLCLSLFFLLTGTCLKRTDGRDGRVTPFTDIHTQLYTHNYRRSRTSKTYLKNYPWWWLQTPFNTANDQVRTEEENCLHSVPVHMWSRYSLTKYPWDLNCYTFHDLTWSGLVPMPMKATGMGYCVEGVDYWHLGWRLEGQWVSVFLLSLLLLLTLGALPFTIQEEGRKANLVLCVSGVVVLLVVGSLQMWVSHCGFLPSECMSETSFANIRLHYATKGSIPKLFTNYEDYKTFCAELDAWISHNVICTVTGWTTAGVWAFVGMATFAVEGGLGLMLRRKRANTDANGEDMDAENTARTQAAKKPPPPPPPKSSSSSHSVPKDSSKEDGWNTYTVGTFHTANQPL